MRKAWYVVIPVAVATSVVALAWLSVRAAPYTPPAVSAPQLETLRLLSYPAATSVDVVGSRRGLLVLDSLHFNFFFQGDLEKLLSKISNLGYAVNYFGDRLALQVLDEAQRESKLKEALQQADSFLVVAPLREYTAAEALLVRNFVDKGGRVVLAADPGRFHRMNSLATALGLNYENDYLYNVVEHETNFRNVLFRNFTPHQVTAGLTTIALYTSGSITGAGTPLVLGDAYTHSSTRESAGLLAPVMSALDGRVVAIGDITFLQSPFSEVVENDRFLNNLADFLTTSERLFTLEDFPAFFGSEVDVVMVEPGVLGPATELNNLLTAFGRRTTLTALDDPTRDAALVGLFAGSDKVSHHLRAAEVLVANGQITSPFGPPIRQEGSALLLLDARENRTLLVLLASSQQELTTLVRLIQTGEFRRRLVSPDLGLYELSPKAG